MIETLTPPRRWDPVVKITHWSIAFAVLANALVTEEGSGSHIWVGYGLAAILALRLLWGLIGPAEARFSAFWPSPRKAIAHIREIREGKVTQHRSHNPLGALMVFAIWGSLLTIIATGIAMAGPPPWNNADQPGKYGAPVTSAASAEGFAQRTLHDEDEHHEKGEKGEKGEEGPLEEIHETAANLLYVLILLHLAGVVFETRRSGKQVMVAMLPFKR